MIETLIAERWLRNILGTDSSLHALVGERIYGYLAPHKTIYPLVLFDLSPGRESHDSMGVSGTRIMSELAYVVRAIGETETFQTLGPIAERIDVLLHKARGRVTDDPELTGTGVIPFKLASGADVVAVGSTGTGEMNIGKELETVRYTFQLQEEIEVDHAQIYCKMVGNALGSLRIGLYEDGQGGPGTEIDSQTIAGVSASWAWKEVAISATLAASTAYWLVIDQTGVQDSSNYYVANAGNAGTHEERLYEGALVGNVLSCVRMMPISEVEADEMSGRVFRHLGGMYQIQVQKA